MSRLRVWQIIASVFVTLSQIPGAQQAARHFKANELIGIIPGFPAYTAIFFGIVILMVSLFINADSYKNPAAIRQARQFLKVFDILFWVVLALYEAAAIWMYLHFKS